MASLGSYVKFREKCRFEFWFWKIEVALYLKSPSNTSRKKFLKLEKEAAASIGGNTVILDIVEIKDVK